MEVLATDPERVLALERVITSITPKTKTGKRSTSTKVRGMKENAFS